MAPQPLFFLVRPGVTTQTPSGSIHKQPGPIVPLIALDDLPDWIDIVDAPRELAVEQTVGLGNLGTIAKADGTYTVRIAYSADEVPAEAGKQSWADLVETAAQGGGQQQRVPASSAVSTVTTGGVGRGQGQQQSQSQPQPQSLQPQQGKVADIHPADRMRAHWNVGQHARNVGLEGSIHNQPPQPKSSAATVPSPAAPQHHHHHQADELASHSVTATSVQAVVAQTSSSQATPQPARIQTHDEYCRHWCHHGTCKWGQQCRYKHAMPTTAEGLVEVGLSEFPTWWLAKMLVGGNSSSSNTLNNSNSNTPSNGIDVNNMAITAAGAALGLGLTPYPRQENAASLNLNLARPYYAARLAALRRQMGGQGHQGHAHAHIHTNSTANGSISNRKLKSQLREALGLLRELGLSGAATPALPFAPGFAAPPRPKVRKTREMTPLEKGGAAPRIETAMTSVAALNVPTVVGAGGGVGGGNGNGNGDTNGDVRVVQQQQGVQAQAGRIQGQDQARTQAVIVGSDGQQQQREQGQDPRPAAHGLNDGLKANAARQTPQSQQGTVVVLPPAHARTPSSGMVDKLVDI